MKVSIIMPVYKVEKFLGNCIESILHQSYKDWELILIDDGSPDRSGDICDEYASSDYRIKVIHKQNEGPSSARNTGIDIMKGEYVTFIDSDDFWHKDYLKVMMEFIINEDAELAQCGFIRGKKSHFPEIESQFCVHQYDNHTVFHAQASNIIIWGKVFKSELFNEVRMPNGFTYEDDWTTWKLYYKASKIVVTNQPLYYYTQNPNSIMGVKNKKPDMSYFGAYEERINFFIERGEKDLEDVSRMQFCKSLLMLYSNELLTAKERSRVKSLFDENWSKIVSSSFVPRRLKIVFHGFHMLPYTISKAVVRICNINS